MPYNINIEEETIYFNNKAKEYLLMIQNEYNNVLPPQTKDKIASLINDNIVILEENHNKYVENQTQIGELESLKELPSAHGGKVFNDQKIHIYLNKFSSFNRNTIESIIIHELFHYLISPIYSNNISKDENSFLTEGLVDMYAIKFMQKNEIFPEYNSNYARNIIFIREKLLNLQDEKTIELLSFNGSMDQIIQNTSSSLEEFKNDLYLATNNQTKFDNLLNNIASLLPNHKEHFIRAMLRMSSRVNSLEEALSTILSSMNEIDELTTYVPNVEKLINEYLYFEKSKKIS